MEGLLRYIDKGSDGMVLEVVSFSGNPYYKKTPGAVTIVVKGHGKITISENVYNKVKPYLKGVSDDKIVVNGKK